MTNRFYITLCILLLGSSIWTYACEVLNPMSYGVLDAKTGMERYNCLFACHKDAVKKNAIISYAGIERLELEIPQNAQSIPLTHKTEFNNVVLHVLNKQKNITLFTLYRNALALDINQVGLYDSKFYIENFSKGNHIIIVEEQIPWTERAGYNTSAHRNDIILLKNGLAENDVVYQYKNLQDVKLSYVETNKEPIAFRNIRLERDSMSTAITNLIYIKNYDNILLENLTINTPVNNLSSDAAISLTNCTNIKLNEVTIDGTYSQKNKSGYGVLLGNVLNIQVRNMKAFGAWGVFGTYNVNMATLIHCDINRFDIHCYGKDVRCYNCNFSDLYNQYSSVYGDVYYENCTFTNFIPVLIEPSYNAYTPFDLTFKTCTFNLTGKKNYFMTLSGLEEAHNQRPELSRKALPNISIKNCTVNLTDDVKKWYVVNTGKVAYKEPLDYISKIEIDGLTIKGNVDYKLFSTELETTRPLKVVRKRVKMKNK